MNITYLAKLARLKLTDVEKQRFSNQMESIIKSEKSSLTFEHNKRNHSSQKGRGYQIIFLIIILSLLAYKLLIS